MEEQNNHNIKNNNVLEQNLASQQNNNNSYDQYIQNNNKDHTQESQQNLNKKDSIQTSQNQQKQEDELSQQSKNKNLQETNNILQKNPNNIEKPIITEQIQIEKIQINTNNKIIQETTIQTTLIQEQKPEIQINQQSQQTNLEQQKTQKNDKSKDDKIISSEKISEQLPSQQKEPNNNNFNQKVNFSETQKNTKNKTIDNFSHKAQHGSVCDYISKDEQKQTIKEINKQLHQEPYCPYSKVYCYGNCEGDQFKVELTREGQTQQYFQTRKPFEIKKFDEMKKKIIKLVTGSMHSVVITEEGEVYTWGNNDSGQLGRIGEQTTPLKVDLEEQVDIVGAGESFTILGNSQTGTIFFFGKIKSPFKNLVQHNLPLTIRYNKFKKNKIQDIKCGQNHILVLSNQRVYVWGDNSQGALGNQFRREFSRVDFERPTCINKRGVIKIFTNDFSSFIVAKQQGKQQKQIIYAFGLNNFNQLGFESEDENKGIEVLPVEWTQISGNDIQDIQGGEHHTFVLFKNGDLYGAGKNDEGQLGELDQDIESLGTFLKLKHLPFKVSQIICSSHFTYALDQEQKNYYAWGFGYDYVLANGKEDSLFVARKINNEKFFQLFPKIISLGTNFVTYIGGSLGQVQNLQSELKTKKKRVYRGPKIQQNKQKLEN